MYRPASGPRAATVTLVPGVHMDGIREARLVGMAEDLAASGFSVLTVATPDLQRFRITPASTDIIEDAAEWLVQGVAGERRQDRHARHQLLGRPVDRRRGTPRAARQGGVRDVVRRPRRSAARHALSLLGQRAADARARRSRARRSRRGARLDPAAARLRRRRRAADLRRADRARRSGRAAAPGHPDVPDGVVARHGRQAAGRSRVQARPRSRERRCPSRRAR